MDTSAMSKSMGSIKEHPRAGVQQEKGPQPLLHPGRPKTMLYRDEKPYLPSAESSRVESANSRTTPFIVSVVTNTFFNHSLQEFY